ncbi:MAG: HesA/MoeB/ThiF family protein [Candidatus Limisoma sp.]|nr:HesA/MoeB/ThiF family protein [Candidatus Limisoma sp.]
MTKMNSTTISDDYRERYKRHLMLPELGEEGQQRLQRGSVLIVGAGGLGCPVAIYLAAAGVGRIGIIDFDKVDTSNLQRQIAYTEAEVGEPKVEMLSRRLRAMNSALQVDAIARRFDADTAELVDNYDVIIDASDNLATKYFCNDVCVEHRRPLVHASINQFTGNVMTILPGTVTLRDVFPEAIEVRSSSTFGVLGVIPGIAGTVQAAEAIKLLAGIGDLLTNRLFTFDALSMQFNVVDLG